MIFSTLPSRISRTRLGGTLFAASLAAASCFIPAQAAVSHADRIPADATVVLSIPNSATFWQKLQALPVSGIVTRYLDGPEMKTNLDYQQFELERAKLSEKLGFQASPAVLLGDVFSDAAFYVRPVSSGGVPPMGLMMGVKDAAKAQKLVAVLNEKFKQQADLTSATFSFGTVDVGGTQLSHFTITDASTGQSHEGYYGLGKDLFVFASSQDAAAQCLGQTPPTGGALSDSASLKKLADMLPWDQADATGWINADALMKALGTQMAQMGVTQPGEMRMAFASQIQPNGIMSKYASTADPAKLQANISAGKLDGLAFLPATPIYSVINRGFDWETLYNEISKAAQSPSVAAMMRGEVGSSPIAQIEQTLGISIREDLLPALDNEMFASIGNININMSLPPLSSVELVVGSKLRDPQKAAATMKKIEAAISKRVSPSPLTTGTQTAAASSFVVSQHAGVEIHTMPLPLPTLTPSYAIAGNYLLIGLNSAAVSNAIDRQAGTKPSLASSAPFKSLSGATAGAPLYAYSILDIQQLQRTVVQPLLAQVAAQGGGQAPVPQLALDLLASLNNVAAIQYEKQDTLLGFMNIQMN